MTIHQKITYLIDNDFSEDEDGILWDDVVMTITPHTVNDEDTTLIMHSILNEALQEDKRVGFVWLFKEIKNDVNKVKFLIDVAKTNIDSYFCDCILEVVSFLPHTKENSDTIIELLQEQNLNQNFKKSLLYIFSYSDNIQWIDTTKLTEILKDKKQSDVIKESIQKIIEEATTPSYRQQIVRIKEKFAQAKEIDREFKVFGASYHQYRLGRTATQKEVSDFEERYSVELPECYKAFITEFCGISAIEPTEDRNSFIPAPFYGFFSFNHLFDAFEGVYDYQKYLQKEAYISPCMRWWSEWNGFENEDMDEFLYGLLPIGQEDIEGYYVYLILNGKYKGRVVYSDLYSISHFCYEDNFLDWYERWLDEVIQGNILQNFAHHIIGDEEELLNKLNDTEDECTQLQLLDSFDKFKSLKKSSLTQLSNYFNSKNKDIYYKTIELIAKYGDDDLEVEELKKMIKSASDDKCADACLIIFEYKKDKIYWKDMLIERLKTVKSTYTLSFILDILDKIKYNYLDEILPLLEGADSYKKEEIYDKIDKFPNKAFTLTLKIKWHNFVAFIKDIFIVATMLIIGVLYFSIWILIIIPFEYISSMFKKLGRSKNE